MKNLKQLINNAYKGKRLTLNEWRFLTCNIKELPEQFLIDFLPFFNWNCVRMEKIGYQKMYNILFGRSHKSSNRHQEKRYWSQYPNLLFDWSGGRIPYYDPDLDRYVYGTDFPDFEYDDAFSLIMQDFLCEFLNFPKYLQNRVIESLWEQSYRCSMFIEDLSWTNPGWEYNFAIKSIFSKDIGENTDSMLAGILLFDYARCSDVVRAINIDFPLWRLVSIYRKYIENDPENDYKSLAGYPPLYDFLDGCSRAGLLKKTVPGAKERYESRKKKENE